MKRSNWITHAAVAAAVCTVVLVASVAASEEYDMEELCGRDISMIFDGVHQGVLQLDADDLKYDNRRLSTWPCVTTIESWYSWPQIMFYFEEINIDCDDGFLTLLEDKQGSTIQGMPAKICGSNIPTGVFNTKSKILKVTYTALRRTSRDDTFSMVFTAFSSDLECYEHKCGNGRCIHEDVVCSGYNSCGDYSDCDKGLSGAAVAGIVIGSLIGLGFLITLAVVICCCLKVKHTKQQQRPRSQAVVYTANPTPAPNNTARPVSFVQPTYGVTNQAFVSAQQPAYPMNFQYHHSEPAAPQHPPQYSELYPESVPVLQGTSMEANEQQKSFTENDFSNVATLQVRGFDSKESEAFGTKQAEN